jgi:hypothetical protein
MDMNVQIINFLEKQNKEGLHNPRTDRLSTLGSTFDHGLHIGYSTLIT